MGHPQHPHYPHPAGVAGVPALVTRSTPARHPHLTRRTAVDRGRLRSTVVACGASVRVLRVLRVSDSGYLRVVGRVSSTRPQRNLLASVPNLAPTPPGSGPVFLKIDPRHPAPFCHFYAGGRDISGISGDRRGFVPIVSDSRGFALVLAFPLGTAKLRPLAACCGP